MPIYNLIEYNANYLKTSGSLWQYFKSERALNNSGGIIRFPDDNNNTASIEFKQKITGQTEDDKTKDFEISVLFGELWKCH